MPLTDPLPNIVVILADDLGYGDLSCQNPQAKTRTPAHDRLASEGMRFTDAHSNSAVCTPTRYGLLTGRYCWRSRLKRGVLYGYDAPLIEPGRVTLASLLRQRGYATACIGKWHLGLGWALSSGGTVSDEGDGRADDPGVDYTTPLTAGPHSVGFDESYIISASLDMPPYCYIQNGRVVEPPTMACARGTRPAMWRPGPIAAGFDHQHCLLDLTRRAEAYIERRAAAKQPFFLYFATPSPHTPHVPRSPFLGTSEAGPYGDLVHEHDWSVGRVIDAIDRHGLTDQTLVIVTSDNGAHVRGNAFDFERTYGHRSNHIYRGQKSDCWDGGHRVPMIARWPGVVPVGSACDATVCLTDLLATAAAIPGPPPPEGAGEDSVDLSRLLRADPDAPPPRENVIHHSINGEFAIRSGRWKLITCKGSGGWSLTDSQAGDDAMPVQLYDMAADPEETTNLAQDQAEITGELTKQLDRVRASTTSCGPTPGPTTDIGFARASAATSAPNTR